jgi:competence protein ComEC
MKRPLLPVALLYAGGILAAHAIPLSPILLLSLSLSIAILVLAWSRVRAWGLCPLIVLTGWTNFTLHTAVISPHDLRNILGEQPQIITVRGTLRETPTLRLFEHEEKAVWRTVSQLEVAALCPNRGSWQPAQGRLAVSTPGALTNFFARQVVEVLGVAAPPKIAAAEGTFDYRAYLRQLGIYYHLQAASEQDWQLVSSPAKPPLADRFRAWAREALARGLPMEDESLRLQWALTLGWKPALTEEVSEPFIQAATYHIFAVDGLRMAILFGIFFSLFRAFGLPRPICGAGLIPLLWFYVGLTGWPASAIRATVMLTVVILGWVIRRPTELLNSLLVAALIILVWQPQQLFQAGFQLSFLVVLCIILILTPLRSLAERWFSPDPLVPAQLRRPWPAIVRVPTRYLAGLTLTSLAAWIGSLPLVAYYFHIVTPVSTPANVVAVPLCGLVLCSNLISLLLGAWFPGAAELFNHAGWQLMEWIRVTSVWFSHWPHAYFYVPAPSLVTSTLYYGVLVAVATGWLFQRNLRSWKLAGFACLTCCWGWQSWQGSSATRLSILASGGGTAIYFDAPGSRNDLLIDCGTTNSVRLVIKPFLRAQGLSRLPGLLLTHGDLHHVGGAQMIAGLFSANQVLASPVRFRSAAYRRTLAEFNQKPGLVRNISCGDQTGPWRILYPQLSDHYAQADDNALVLAGVIRGTRVLLLSDLGRAGQEALLERTPDLRADIVVASLPSAGEALSDALIGAIQPRLIVIQDLEFPVSERAGSKLRERLAQCNVPVIYTRSAGAATIEFRGKEWELRTMSGTGINSRNSKPQKPNFR